MSSESPKPKGTPGWNDPPIFSYESQVQGQIAKLSLTKRVSFPLASSSESSNQQVASSTLSQSSTGKPPSHQLIGTPPGLLSTGPPPSQLSSGPPPTRLSTGPPPCQLPVGPPPGQLSTGPPPSQLSTGPSPNRPTTGPPPMKLSSGLPLTGTPPGQVSTGPPPHQLSSEPPSSTRPSDDIDISFNQVYDNLESQIEALCNDNERSAADIRKKIKNLENMWNEKKLNSGMKQKILELSEAVKKKNVKAGQELQRSLMVDHASVCGSWIPAIRHILNYLDSTHPS